MVVAEAAVAAVAMALEVVVIFSVVGLGWRVSQVWGAGGLWKSSGAQVCEWSKHAVALGHRRSKGWWRLGEG